MYRSLNEIAADIVEVLEALNVFKYVEAAAVSNGSQLFKAAANIRLAPAALVCIGEGDFENHGSLRTFSPVIIILADYRSGLSRNSENIWTLTEAAIEPFLPVFQPGTPPVFPEINGIKYELKGWSPVDSDDRTSAFAVELEAVEVFKIQTT